MNVNRTVIVAAIAVLPTLASAQSRHHHSPTSTVYVDNDTSATMTVTVDGNSRRTLAPHESGRFTAWGDHATIHADYRLYGETRALVDAVIRVSPGRSTWYELNSPRQALVEVVNETGVSAELIADGREVAELRAGQTRFVSLPVGRTDLRMVANGVTVERRELTLRALEETVIVGRAPRFADVTVYNPFPFAVTLTCDRGMRRTVEAYGRTTYDDVAVGSFHLVATRANGQRVDEERINVRAWSGGSWTLDPPSTGLVRIDSDVARSVRVTVDGRIVTILPGFGEATVELPVGVAWLEARDLDGDLVERERVTVEAFRNSTVHIDEARHDSRDADRDDGRGHHLPADVSDAHEEPAGGHCHM
jgi:hypothetical protein